MTAVQTLTAADYCRLLAKPRRRHKYNVSPVPDRTWRGKCYASKAEMAYAQHLDADVCVLEVVEQPRLRMGEDHVYVPDFMVVTTYGHHYYADVKGMETPAFRKSKKLWAKYGRLDLLVVKARQTRRSATGYEFAVNEIVKGGAARG